MPKYTQENAERRARRLVKPLIENGFNESAVARLEGVTPQAINERLKNPIVKDILREYLESPKLKATLIDVARSALKAKKYTKKGTKPDFDARHKYWHDLMTGSGVIKSNGNGGIKIVNVIYGYSSRPLNSALRVRQPGQAEPSEPDAAEGS